ncbi:MAG TPA: hypothetical protein VFF64_23605 [Candidatus Eremiobacteraceae bacterium]|nr:hypothetical protein [Candidatus Eremiobacteraceae bacterium]
MTSYPRLRLKRAVLDTVSFWNVHRTWTNFVPPFIGVVGIILSYISGLVGLKLLSNAALSVAFYGFLWAGFVWIAGWLGSFLINYIVLSPKALHEECTNEAEAARQKTAEITAELLAERGRNARPEITIAVTEGLFEWGPFEGTSGADRTTRADFIITLGIQLVNIRPCGPPTVVDWSLEIETAGRTFHPQRERITDVLLIERDTRYRRTRTGISRKVTEALAEFDEGRPLVCGLPVSGYIRFVIRDLEKSDYDAFQDNMTLKLCAVDSFGQTHEFMRPPQVWPKNARIVAGPDSFA